MHMKPDIRLMQSFYQETYRGGSETYDFMQSEKQGEIGMWRNWTNLSSIQAIQSYIQEQSNFLCPPEKERWGIYREWVEANALKILSASAMLITNTVPCLLIDYLTDRDQNAMNR